MIKNKFLSSILKFGLKQNKKMNFSAKLFPHFSSKTFSNYLYIKDFTKIHDLKYKEEIFEFLSMHNENLNTKEISQLIDLLSDKIILPSELKELKIFLQNLIEIQDNYQNDKECLSKVLSFFSIQYFNVRELKNQDNLENVIETRLNNSEYDHDFFNIWVSAGNLMLKSLEKVNAESFKDIFTFISEGNAQISSKDFYNVFIQNIMDRIEKNEFSNEDRLDIAIIFFVLFSKKKFTIDVFDFEEIVDLKGDLDVNGDNGDIYRTFVRILETVGREMGLEGSKKIKELRDRIKLN